MTPIPTGHATELGLIPPTCEKCLLPMQLRKDGALIVTGTTGDVTINPARWGLGPCFKCPSCGKSVTEGK